ncbi:MAG: cytochrome c [Alphaproteobacteria bacterium]|jgi:mono/diheme cytochrome c family protein|nr:cytochrome c [Alphaproteobacteria bacterium]
MTKQRKKRRPRQRDGETAATTDRRVRLQWLGLAVLVAGLVIWFAWPTPTVVDVRVPKLSRLAEKGQLAFNQNCVACHGENAAGSDQGPPLVHEIYNSGHHADFSFRRAVRQGVRQHHWRFGNMPAQPQVSKTELASIVRFVRELQQANGIAYRRHRM